MIKINAEDLPNKVFTSADMEQMWEYVRWTLKINMNWIMIGFAAGIVTLVIGVILSIFFRRDLGDEDDEEIEVRYH